MTNEIRTTNTGRTVSGFKVRLRPGNADEFKQRYSEMWPAFVEMLRSYGARRYSLFLDEEENCVFGCAEVEDAKRFGERVKTDLCKSWNTFLASTIETNPDRTPVEVPLACAVHVG